MIDIFQSILFGEALRQTYESLIRNLSERQKIKQIKSEGLKATFKSPDEMQKIFFSLGLSGVIPTWSDNKCWFWFDQNPRHPFLLTRTNSTIGSSQVTEKMYSELRANTPSQQNQSSLKNSLGKELKKAEKEAKDKSAPLSLHRYCEKGPR